MSKKLGIAAIWLMCLFGCSSPTVVSPRADSTPLANSSPVSATQPKVYDVFKVDTPPAGRLQGIPTMAPWLSKSGIGGRALVVFTIYPDGSVGDVVLENCTDLRFGAQCAKGVLRWKFTPALVSGSAISCRVREQINYNLHLADGSWAPIPAYLNPQNADSSQTTVWNSYDISVD